MKLHKCLQRINLFNLLILSLLLTANSSEVLDYRFECKINC